MIERLKNFKTLFDILFKSFSFASGILFTIGLLLIISGNQNKEYITGFFISSFIILVIALFLLLIYFIILITILIFNINERKRKESSRENN